jgi:hypothetical protein
MNFYEALKVNIIRRPQESLFLKGSRENEFATSPSELMPVI